MNSTVILSLLVVTLASSSGQKVHPQLRLTPFQAMNQIADTIAADPKLVNPGDPQPLPPAMRKKIAKLASEVDWPILDNTKPWQTNKTLKALSDEIDASSPNRLKKEQHFPEYLAIFRASMSLVLTAWDKHVRRTQYCDSESYLRCCDNTALLLVGKTYLSQHDTVSPTISWDWPWAKKGWSLRPVIIHPFPFNSPDSTYDDLVVWNESFGSLKTILKEQDERNPHP